MEGGGRQLSCEERVEGELAKRLADLREMWGRVVAECEEDEFEKRDDVSRELGEYGLCFDYVEALDDEDGEGEGGYFRWQLSWGGPSDEFRFFADYKMELWRVEYRFMDWFDGASRLLTGDDFRLLRDIWESEFADYAAELDVLRESV